jgi:hypothetical protein
LLSWTIATGGRPSHAGFVALGFPLPSQSLRRAFLRGGQTAPRHFVFAAAFFFLAAHAFFIVSDIFLRKAASFAGAALCLAAAGALAVAGLDATAGTAAAAFAALIAAQRFFVAAIIARLPAALSFRFTGAVGPAVSGVFESGVFFVIVGS